MSDEIRELGASSHTSGRMSARIEVISHVSGRRRWTVEQKLLILRDAFGPDGSVRSACERHEVGSGLIYTWRRQAMSGELTGVKPPALPAFAAVELSSDVPLLPTEVPAPQSSQIGIELPSGVRLTVETGFDADALARVLAVLQG
jgi:transposase